MRHLAVFLFALISFMLFRAAPVAAVNFGAGARVAPVVQFSAYPYFYQAETRTDKNGNAAVNDLGLKKYGTLVGGTWYFDDYVLNMLIPVGSLEVGKTKSTASGLGDIQLRAGRFLPVQSLAILPTIMLKVPSGDFDKKRPANFGDGQTDLSLELYLNKIFDDFAIDSLTRYTVRFRNPDSDVTPGNEFTSELLVTWRLAERLWVGPACNLVVSDDGKRAGQQLADSGYFRYSVGAEIYYGRLDRLKLSLAGYQDIVTSNTNEGFLLMSRIIVPF